MTVIDAEGRYHDPMGFVIESTGQTTFRVWRGTRFVDVELRPHEDPSRASDDARKMLLILEHNAKKNITIEDYKGPPRCPTCFRPVEENMTKDGAREAVAWTNAHQLQRNEGVMWKEPRARDGSIDPADIPLYTTPPAPDEAHTISMSFVAYEQAIAEAEARGRAGPKGTGEPPSCAPDDVVGYFSTKGKGMAKDYTNPTGAQIPGYRQQSQANLEIVKFQKEWEERILRHLDWLKAQPGIDQRWLAQSRTSMENGFMQVNRAVMQPQRIALPEDAEPDKLAYNQKPPVEANQGPPHAENSGKAGTAAASEGNAAQSGVRGGDEPAPEGRGPQEG